MRRTEEIKQNIRSALETISGDLKGYRVFIFGSRASGKHKPRSDFDIGIDGDTVLPIRLLDKIENILESIDTLFAFDVVDFTRAQESFKKQALSQIEMLYG